MDQHSHLINAYADISSRKRIATAQLPELWLGLYRHQTIDLDVSPAPSGLGKRHHYGGLVSARASRLEEIWRMCSIILIKRLWQSKHAPPFLQPVDPVALNILDYYNYVQRPMDLRTIKERIASMHYRTPFEFRDDVRQVWLNCTLYNPPNHPVRVAGDEMSDLWEKSWLESGIEAAWRDFEVRYGNGGTSAALPASRRNSQPGADQVDGMQVDDASTADVRPCEESNIVREIPGTPPGTEPELGQPDSVSSQFMEKRRMVHLMSVLSGEHLQSILDIVLSNEAIEGGSFDPSDHEKEVEIDIDKLRPETLFALQNHLDKLSALAGPRWPGGPPTKTASLISTRMPRSIDLLQAPDKLPTSASGRSGSLRIAAAAAALDASAPDNTPTGHYLRHHAQPTISVPVSAPASGQATAPSSALPSPRTVSLAVHSVSVQQPVTHTAAAVNIAQADHRPGVTLPLPTAAASASCSGQTGTSPRAAVGLSTHLNPPNKDAPASLGLTPLVAPSSAGAGEASAGAGGASSSVSVPSTTHPQPTVGPDQPQINSAAVHLPTAPSPVESSASLHKPQALAADTAPPSSSVSQEHAGTSGMNVPSEPYISPPLLPSSPTPEPPKNYNPASPASNEALEGIAEASVSLDGHEEWRKADPSNSNGILPGPCSKSDDAGIPKDDGNASSRAARPSTLSNSSEANPTSNMGSIPGMDAYT